MKHLTYLLFKNEWHSFRIWTQETVKLKTANKVGVRVCAAR